VRALRLGPVDVWLFRPAADDTRAAARGTLRTILSRYLDMDPEEVPFVRGPQGKPRLAPEVGSTLRFNLSHSGRLAAVAVTRREEVGVDLELRAPRPRMPILADAMLAPRERAWFDGLPPSARTKGFYDLWCAKEACSKLIGRGLTMPFSAISLESPAAEVSAVSVEHSSAPEGPCLVWRLPLDAGYSGAVAALE
jgi:4'-phosphopantetheinyl transferase